MRNHVLLLFVIPLFSTVAAQAAPGWLAIYSDRDHTVHQVVATPNFSLAANESIHSQIAPSFEARYLGVLRITRGGEYTISGDAQIEINGKQILDKPIRLTVGDHSLKMSYRRKAGPARLQLRWKSDFFIEEPIPPSAFAHGDTNEAHDRWAQIERGRAWYEDLSCGSCHGARGWDLTTRRGPDLSDIGSRVTRDWLARWLDNPRHYRKTSVMPSVGFKDKEIADVVEFLSSLKTSSNGHKASAPIAKKLDGGKDIFVRIGCLKCHDDSGHSLSRVGSKYQSARELANFVGDPLHIDPSGRMPQMFDPVRQAKEVDLVAEYLYHSMKADWKAEAQPADGDANRGKELVQSHGCVACHTIKQDGQRLPNSLQTPRFASQSNKLLHYWSFDGHADDAVAANNGRVVGATSYTDGNDKIPNSKAFDFDGKTYLVLSHFKRPDVLSITAWIKTTKGGEILAWSQPQVGTREFRVNVNGKDTLIYGENNINGEWKLAVGRSPVLIDNQWHHVAVVRDGVRAQVYLDGKPLGDTGTVQVATGAYSNTLLIGAILNHDKPHRNFHGALDDLAVWSKALSDEEIAALAKGGSAKLFDSTSLDELSRFDIKKGCLADAPGGETPDYNLSTAQRSDLQAFMGSIAEQPVVSTAPVESFNRAVRQFKCTACHSFNGIEQPARQVTEDGRLVKIERPPTLTAAGEKLQVRWIQDVLLNKKRTRPWMKMRMPHFGTDIQQLPKYFPAASGSTFDDESPTPRIELANSGLKMIGHQRGKAACINCHSYRGINRQKEGVVPAPDMSEIGETLRRDWFVRWLHNPVRMSPGTSMPQFFLELDDEERMQKIEQLWAALSHQERLPLPKGLIESHTEGTRVVVGDDPVLFRFSTRTPKRQVDRAINVGLPGGTNFTFDAATAQLEYAWKGAFVDAGPVWNGRGGNPVSVRGESLFTATGAFPLRIGEASSEPKVRFLGYYLVRSFPVFRFTVDGIEVHERIDVTEDELVRHFSISESDKPVFFIADENRTYATSAGEFNDRILEISAGKNIEFEVRSKHK